MGNGMNKIITGVYVGNYRDAKDVKQLTDNNITHILAIHDNAKAVLEDKTYLCIHASDHSDQPLTQFFPQCIDFIHKARMEQGCVLIHCLAGVSRSVTVTAAYIMTVTNLGWKEAINAIRAARSMANPNYGFQRQLHEYENEGLKKTRQKFKEDYPVNDFNDVKECEALLKCYNHFVMTGENHAHPEFYSLPHRAYTDRNKPNTDAAEGDPKADRKHLNNEQCVNVDSLNGTGTNSSFNADDEKS